MADDFWDDVPTPAPTPSPYSEEYSARWTPAPTPTPIEDDFFPDDFVERYREPTPKASRPAVVDYSFWPERDPESGNILTALSKVHPHARLARQLGALGMEAAGQHELAYMLKPGDLTEQEQHSLRSWGPTAAITAGSLLLPEAAIAAKIGMSIPTVAGGLNVLGGQAERTWQNWNEGMPLGEAFREGISPMTSLVEAALPAVGHGILRAIGGGDELVGGIGLDAPIPNRVGSGAWAQGNPAVPGGGGPMASYQTPPMGMIPVDTTIAGAQVPALRAAKDSLNLGTRSAAGWLPGSPSKHLRMLYEDMRNADVISARFEQAGMERLDSILANVHPSEYEAVGHYVRGSLNGPPTQVVQEAGDRFRSEILKPFARGADAVNLTTVRGGKLGPFAPKQDPYLPEYYKPREDVVDLNEFVNERATGRTDPLAHAREASGEDPIVNIKELGTHYIRDWSKKIGLAGAFGPTPAIEGGVGRFGIDAQWALKNAAEEGLDPTGHAIAAQALETEYFPRITDKPFLKNAARIPGQMFLGRNFVTQLRQGAASLGRYGWANTAEGMTRYLTDPEFRRMMRTSGAMEPGYLQNLQEAGILGDDPLASSIKGAEYVNRGFFSSGAIPQMQRLERMTQAGAWTDAMAREAAEAGVTREMLREGLSAGDIQNAIARTIQDVQLYPGGVGQRIGFSQDPGMRRIMGYADFPITQSRMFKQRTYDPIFRGMEKLLSGTPGSAHTDVGLGLGRLGRQVTGAAGLGLGTEVLRAALSGSPPPDMIDQGVEAFDPYERALDVGGDVTGWPGTMLEAGVKGYPLLQAFAGAPLASALQGVTDNPVDAAIVANTMFPGNPLQPVGAMLPFLRGPINDWVRYIREGQ